MRPRIFKLQISLNTACAQFPPRVLVYDKRYEYTGEFPATKEVIKLFGKRKKMYWWGKPPLGKGQVLLIKPARNQRW